MKLTILNKNFNRYPVEDYSLAKEYSITPGFVLTKCFNETLDSATVRIENILEIPDTYVGYDNINDIEVDHSYLMIPKEEIRKKIEELGQNEYVAIIADMRSSGRSIKLAGYQAIGFAIDSSGIWSLEYEGWDEGQWFVELNNDYSWDNLPDEIYFEIVGAYSEEDAGYITGIRSKNLNVLASLILNYVVPGTRPIDIDVLDIVKLSGDARFEDKYMLVDDFIEREVCLNPKVYSYEIHLCSQIKEFEGVVLPDLKITKMPNITRSVGWYLRLYLWLYGPKVKTYDNEDNAIYKARYSFDTELTNDDNTGYFDTIECPEMQWNQPTLREVFNDLFIVGDRIVILEGLTIKSLDISKDTGTNDLNSINYITKSKASDDYISELHMNMVNVTGDKSKSVTKIQKVTFTSEEGFMTSENFQFKTDYPIYRINSCKMMFQVSYDNNDARWVEVDLMNVSDGTNHYRFLYEEKEWAVLNTRYTKLPVSDGILGLTLSEITGYKNFTLHYTRGSQYIEGWHQQSSQWFHADQDTIYYMKLALADKATLEGQPSTFDTADITLDDYPLIFFTIEYETLEGNVFRAGKSEKGNERVVVDNQSYSYIDCYNQGLLEYFKANRLGNLNLAINGRYNVSLTDILPNKLEIGNRVKNDYIVYQCEYQIFDDHVDVNALATKNYVLRNYFTGVKSKVRSWKIAEASDALTRKDLIKRYLEFSYSSQDWSDNTNFLWFISPFVLTEESIKPATNIAVRFKVPTLFDSGTEPWDNPTGGSLPSSTEFYSPDLIKRIIGKSMCFTISMKDNYYFNSIEDLKESNLGGIQNHFMSVTYGTLLAKTAMSIKDLSYTNSNGEAYGSDGVYLFNKYELTGDFTDPTFYLRPGIAVYNSADLRTEIVNAAKQPVLKGTGFNPMMSLPDFNFYKDSQEITSVTWQYEFCSDSRDIAVGKNYVEWQFLIRDEITTTGDSFIARIVDDSYFDYDNPENLTAGVGFERTATIAYSTTPHPIFGILNYIELNISNFTASLNNRAVYIYRVHGGNRYLLVAFRNIPDERIYVSGNATRVTFYLNQVETRDNNIYKENDLLIVDHKL